MIGSLRGTLIDRSAKGDVIIDTASGVGYKVTVTPATLAAMGELGATVFLHVHTHVREDALVLFGFPHRDERVCFELLLGAHGVGPALALAILTAHTPGSLRTAVATDDADALTLVPGVGKKTAARLLIELKSRLESPDLELASAGVVAAPGALGASSVSLDGGDARADVRAALGELGYGTEEVRAVLRKLPADGDSKTLLRQALAILSDTAATPGARRR